MKQQYEEVSHISLIKGLVHESYKTDFSRVACVVSAFYRTRHRR